jgi:tetratricopeptide (TPR) repeat protein
MYSRSLSLLGEEDLNERRVALQGRGLMRYRIGRYEESVEDLERARDLAARLKDVNAEIEIVLDEATGLDFVSNYSKSRSLVEEAKALSAQVCSPFIEARLQMGLGRSLWRLSQLDEARVILADAAEKAAAVGDPGYEALVASLLMLQSILFNLGRIDEAEAVSIRAKALCAEKGDRMHLSVALNNGRYIWFSRKDWRRALSDLSAALKLSQELGVVGLEYMYSFNIAEATYHVGEVEEAQAYVDRVLTLERRYPEVAPRPSGPLLQARLLAFSGRSEVARPVVDELLSGQKSARSEGRASALLGPSDQVLLGMVDLATRDSTASEWEELCAASARAPMGVDAIELIEMHGLSALRQGRSEGLEALERALGMAAKAPTLLDGRIRRALELETKRL